MKAAAFEPYYDARSVRDATPWPDLIEALRRAFRSPHEAPERHIHTIQISGRADATALLMPAWIRNEVYGVKLTNVFPSNNAVGEPAITALYALFDAKTGRLVALFDGGELTARRTAAASALAASYLARADSRRLIVLGTGRLAPMLALAHASIRPIENIEVWGRNAAKARATAEAISDETGIRAVATPDLAAGIARADIVSAATLSQSPLIAGAVLRPGTHVDLVGAFRPTMREIDGAGIAASRVYVDTPEGARAEAGDLIQAHAEGVFDWADVAGDLAGLCRSEMSGRRAPEEITLFKSVGASIEDLAAARLVHYALGPRGPSAES